MAKIVKRQYYVQYLGWKEVHGVWGREFTESITKELIKRRTGAPLPKLTIEVSPKELKITQQVEKKGKTQKLKYPAIPSKDITYAVQATSPDEDVVSCIYLGYNPQTRCAVHVHVYRCDSFQTAELLADHLTQITEIQEYQKRALRIEQDLVTRDQIRPRPSAFVGSKTYADDISTQDGINDERIPFESGRRDIYARNSVEDYPSRERHQDQDDGGEVYDSLAAELKAKLEARRAKDPILYPPKDYDTIHRKVGNAYIELGGRRDGNDSALGGSENSSARNSRNSADLARARIIGQEDNRSRGSQGSGGFDDFGEDDELKAITPRWKEKQNFMAPNPARAFSPPPDLKGGRSYFPEENDSDLPNYLAMRQSSPSAQQRLGSSSNDNVFESDRRYIHKGAMDNGRAHRRQDQPSYGSYPPEPTYGSPPPRGQPFNANDPSSNHIARSLAMGNDDFVLY